MPDAAPTRQSRARLVLVDALAIAVSGWWFVYNVTRPDTYNGRYCCDSQNFFGLVQMLADAPSWLAGCGHRSRGYPIFLRLHLLLHDALGLPERPDWIAMALVSAFLLFVASSYALYFALRQGGLPVPRWALWLVLIHPGLASYAASPLSDSLTLSLLMLLFAAVLRLDWALQPRNLALAAAIGLLLGAVLQSRPLHLFAAVPFLVALCATGVVQAIRLRSAGSVLLLLLVLGGLAALTLPRALECRRIGGTIGFLAPGDVDGGLANDLRISRFTARTYSWIDEGGGRTVLVPDAFIQEHFSCLPGGPPVMARLVSCVLARAPLVPVYSVKKTMALLDISHLNPHAAAITTVPVRWWNRVFSTLGFAGLVSMAVLVVGAALRRRLPMAVLLCLLYLAVYLAAMLIPHVEARYGLPFVPPSFMALGLLVASARASWPRRWAVGGLLLTAGGVFVAQTVAWDAADPMLAAPPPSGLPRGHIYGVVGIRPGPGAFATPLRNAVVMVMGPVQEAMIEAPHAVMRHWAHAFQPPVLAVPVGTTVDFPNGDPVPHGVTSTSPTHPIDIGPYGPGQTRSVTFDAPGIVPVGCSVHPGTRGFVVVHENPYFAVTDEKGRYAISHVPPGTYDVQAWHDGYVARRTPVSVSAETLTPFDTQLDRAR